MGNDTVIRAEGLGKKYIIGHKAEGHSATLRDAIVRAGRSFARTLKQTASGRAILVGETTEEFWALKDVSFEVKRGEVLGIIGRNGAGKSTLLKLLSRITDPSEGRVEIKGRVASLLEVGTGFHPELTGRENIYLNGAILGMARSEIRRKFDEIVAFSGVERFLDTPVKRYSSGMYVRLAFAVAAHLEPEILIVDEVLAVGDAEFQRKCISKIESITGSAHRTVILVSHNMATMQSLVSHAIYLEGGRTAGAVPVEEAVASYLNRSPSVGRSSFVRTSPPREADAFITAVRVLDQAGRASHRMPTCESFSIEIEWENISGVPANPFIRMRRQDGVNALLASDVPIDIDGTKKESAGSYMSRVKIPANFINAGEFVLDVMLWSSKPQRRLDIEQDVLGFSIWDPMDERCLARGNFNTPVYSVFYPALQWSFDRVLEEPCRRTMAQEITEP